MLHNGRWVLCRFPKGHCIFVMSVYALCWLWVRFYALISLMMLKLPLMRILMLWLAVFPELLGSRRGYYNIFCTAISLLMSCIAFRLSHTCIEIGSQILACSSDRIITMQRNA